jgi:hypothetical protein
MTSKISGGDYGAFLRPAGRKKVLIAVAGTLAMLAFTATPALAASVEQNSVYVAEVGSRSATLHATINPEGASARYVFEYGPSKYESSTPPAGSVAVGVGTTGGGMSGIPVSVPVQGLSPTTKYYYRVVVEGVPSTEETTFTTQPEGGEFALPDGRAWELVSPPEKHGGSIEPLNFEGGVIQAAEAGGAITYDTNGPIVTEPQGNRETEVSQVLSKRGPEGWGAEDIATPTNNVEFFSVGEFAEYKFFSSDLSLGLVEPRSETPLAPRVRPGETQEKTLYLRDDSTGNYLALATAANVEVPGSKINIPPKENEKGEGHGLKFEGASPDLSNVIFSAPEALTKNAVTTKTNNGEFVPSLYEWAGGRLTLVSVLPDKKPANAAGGAQAELGGVEHKMVRHAVSDDGARVVWYWEEHLYLRDMEKEESVQVDAPEPGGEGGGTAVFQTASGDGSRVFFTDEARLTADSSASGQIGGPRDLYVFEVTSGPGEPLAGRLTDLSVDSEIGERDAVQGGVIGASEDGSYVYFVANGLLGNAGEHGAEKGACNDSPHLEDKVGTVCNLYVEHFDGSSWEAPVFIATLSGEDSPSYEEYGGLPDLTARVSPNGRWLAFMSDRRLTGYDNLDVASGAPDEEVYVYDQATGGLACASCNPTGERPAGVFDPRFGSEPGTRALLVDVRGVWSGHWLAGSVPGWTPDEHNAALYQSRYLSNNGRLFFASADALVPADVNGVEDVYEWEPSGVGGCAPGIAGASVVSVAQTGGDGCVGLISAGTSSQESAFLDATATGGRDGEGDEGGGEVFFLTTSELVPADIDGAYDLYTARECASSSPCLSESTSAPPACNNEASCKPAPEPQPSIYGAPASGTSLGGLGNFAAPALGVRPKARVLARAQKLAKALKACRGEKQHSKRMVCEKQARKRYGTVKVRKRA